MLEIVGRPDCRTFGFWFESPPHQDTKKEGIPRALCWILRGAIKQGHRVKIVVPSWSERTLLELLKDQGVPRDSVEIIKCRRRPPLLVRWEFRRAPPKKNNALGLRKRLSRFLKSIIRSLGRENWLVECGAEIVSTNSYLLAALVVALSLPVLLLAAGTYATCLLALRALRWFTRAARKGRDLTQAQISPIRGIVRTLCQEVIEFEYEQLAQLANDDRDVDCWLVAWPWATATLAIERPLVAILWDFVPADLPTVFNGPYMAATAKRCRLVLNHAGIVVSNSEYVRSQHAVRFFGVPREQTRVVPITPRSSADILSDGSDGARSIRDVAIDAIREHFRSKPADQDQVARFHTSGFPFEEVDYLFNSTQLREHKNTLNLLRAFEVLLRRRERNLKLVLTGNPALNPPVLQFIQDRGLQFDVLTVTNLPNKVVAAFYHLAALTVAPTLFEAGIPLMFRESITAGTPIVMGSIPQTLEIVPESLRPQMLFDPGDVASIADRIEYALDHRASLFQVQRALHDSVFQGMNADMGEEIVKFMLQVASPVYRMKPTQISAATPNRAVAG